MSNSRRASRPTTKKNRVIRPLFSHPRRSRLIEWSPSRTTRSVSHTLRYDDESMLIQSSAVIVASSSTPALPVSVPMNSRSGVSRLRAHAVLPEKGLVLSDASEAMPHCAPDYAARCRNGCISGQRRCRKGDYPAGGENSRQ